MISLFEPTAGKGAARLDQLEMVPLGTEPPVWRRLQVSASANLGWLHGVLQVAMGWTNSHLHQFKVGGDCYSDPRHHFAEFLFLSPQLASSGRLRRCCGRCSGRRRSASRFWPPRANSRPASCTTSSPTAPSPSTKPTSHELLKDSPTRWHLTANGCL